MPAPTADFTGLPLSGFASLSVTFADLSTDIPTSWLWEKNSGSGWVNFSGTPTAQSPTETFAAGVWSVRLTATNGSGSNTKTETNYVSSISPGPSGDGGAAANGVTLTTVQSVALTAPAAYQNILSWSVENGVLSISSVSSDTLTCTVAATGVLGQCRVTASGAVDGIIVESVTDVSVVSTDAYFGLTAGSPY